ncbi:MULTISPECIES: hypothetical protein [unclassified Nonomuraea]|uniref:hypothetical protein n=1 Tax=unclassified Nonomuraea TaxID=2593643 RepID=UPI0033CED1F0
MHELLRSPDGTVTLSPLCLDDVDAHLAGEDDELVRYLNGGPGTRATVEAYIRRCVDQWRADVGVVRWTTPDVSDPTGGG